MFIVTFLFFLSGFLFELRILENLFSEKLISKHHLTKIGTILLVIHGFLLAFVPKNIFFVAILLIANIILIFLGENWLRKLRISGFQAQFIGFLTITVLQMKSGKNFSQSFLLATEQLPVFYRERFVEIYNSLMFSENQEGTKTLPLFLRGIVSDLRQIKNRPHNALKGVQNLRLQLIREEKFLAKGRVLSQQCLIQTIVLSLLYFSLLIYVLLSYGLHQNLTIILSSLVLYLAGIASILAIGRNHKWSV